MWETARGKVQAYDRPALTRMTKLLTLSLLALLLLACGSEVKEPSDIQEVGSDGIVSGETYWVHLEGLPVVFITFPKPRSTEEERASGCGWVLRCSWDNGFVRITYQPQGAPIRCYQRATPTG